MSNSYPRIASLKDVDEFRERLNELDLDLPTVSDPGGENSPLNQSLSAGSSTIGNRFAIQPMEGWDGTEDGLPTERTIRRWRNFGRSGAKLIWGGEAVAVRPDGRANPNQLMINEQTRSGLEQLREVLLETHRDEIGSTDDLVVGLQLTHSGRFCRPNDNKILEPKIVYPHPVLDRKFDIDPDDALLSDEEIHAIIDDFIEAAIIAGKLGFDFVDVKHCHGYLGHEFLSAYSREGPYGGDFEGRTRFLRDIVEGIQEAVPGLEIGVRLSAFDMIPFKPANEGDNLRDLGPGIPEVADDVLPYEWGFGVNEKNPVRPDLAGAKQFLSLLEELDIKLVNLSAGSPYYVPHIQRPALFPPSDGYQPPEDPLVGVDRQVQAVAELNKAFPNLIIVGSGYSYLQEYLPHVAEAVVQEGGVDLVGLGRMVLSYPDLPADVLAGEELTRKKICRTFSDCTTAPRNDLPSGCYPLDEYYRDSEEGEQLRSIKND